MDGDKVLGIAIIGVAGALGLWALTRPKTAPAPTPPPAPEMVLMRYPLTGQQFWIFPQDVPAYLAGGWVVQV